MRGEALLLFTAVFWTDILKRDDVNIFSPPRVLNQLSQVAVRSDIVPVKVLVVHVTRLKLWFQIIPVLFLHQGLRVLVIFVSTTEATTYSWSAPSQLQIC